MQNQEGYIVLKRRLNPLVKRFFKHMLITSLKKPKLSPSSSADAHPKSKEIKEYPEIGLLFKTEKHPYKKHITQRKQIAELKSTLKKLKKGFLLLKKDKKINKELKKKFQERMKSIERKIKKYEHYRKKKQH